MKPEPLDFDLSEFLPYKLTVVAEQLSRGLAKQYRAEYGISVPEWRVLVHILHEGEVSVRDVEQKAGLEKSKASRAASRLEADGYITKAVNEQDRRLLVLSLTEKGRALMQELIPLADAFQKRIENLLNGQLQELDSAVDILLDADLEYH